MGKAANGVGALSTAFELVWATLIINRNTMPRAESVCALFILTSVPLIL